MSRRPDSSAVLVLGVAIATAVAGRAATQTGIEWDLMVAGGVVSTSGAITVGDSVGQPVVGGSEAGGVRLEAGLWPGADVPEPGPSPTGPRPTATATRTGVPGTTHTPTVTRTAGARTSTVAPTGGPGPTATASATDWPRTHTVSLPVILRE